MRVRTRVVVLLIVAALLALGSWLVIRAGWLDPHLLVAQVRAVRTHSNVVVAAAAFVAAWTVATPLGFPALPLIVAGGALFGTIPGSLLSLAGTALGGLGGYYVARVVAPVRVQQWLTRRLLMRHGAREVHFMGLLRMRLVPMLPFSAVNYASGFAAVPLGTFLATTVLGQLPSTLLYSFFADRLLRAADMGDDAARTVAVLSALLLLMTLLPRLLDRLIRTRN